MMGMKCSSRGPSLNRLSEFLGVKSLRKEIDGVHGAEIDARMTAESIIKLKFYIGKMYLAHIGA